MIKQCYKYAVRHSRYMAAESGRIDSAQSWLKEASGSPEAKVIQPVAETFSYVSSHTNGFGPGLAYVALAVSLFDNMT